MLHMWYNHTLDEVTNLAHRVNLGQRGHTRSYSTPNLTLE